MDILDDWLRKLGTSSVVLSNTRMPVPWGMRVPSSKDVTFHIVIGGDCWMQLYGDTPQRISAGELVILPQGVGHDIVHEPGAETEPRIHLLRRLEESPAETGSLSVVSGYYHVAPILAGPLLKPLSPVIRVRPSPERAGALLSLLLSELAVPRAASGTLARHLLNGILVFVMREWAMQPENFGQSWLGALHDNDLALALNRMHSSPSAPWTVETLARSAGFSRATFARHFTHQMGEPPLTYLTRWRMLLAAQFLNEQPGGVADVARKVGYDSEYAFSRAFKRHFGVAPTGFRRNAALELAPELAREMASDADRDFVSLFDAPGFTRMPLARAGR